MTDETVFVEVLTDEELSVLARPGGVAVSPYLDAMAPPEQHVARRTAYRSLLARGIVDPPSAEALAAARAADDGGVDLPVRQDVRAVITLREAAQRVVALSRTTPVVRDYWYAHVVDDIALLEEIGSDGLHRFALARAEQLPDLVVAAAVHPAAAGDGTGPPVEVVAPDDPTLPGPIVARLGDDWLRADLVVRHVRDRRIDRMGLFTGPGGSWLVGAQEAGVLEARPMGVEEISERVRRLVGHTREREESHVRT
jgi:hypothetical protein